MTTHVDFSTSFSQQRTCLKGHVIDNDGRYEDAPQPFCSQCGSPTINQCPECQGPLRGAEIYRELPKSPKPDAYCLHCGKPLPWTQAALKAAKEYTDELAELSPEDKAELKASFDELTTDTAQTHLAASRFNRIVNTMAPVAKETVARFAADFMFVNGDEVDQARLMAGT
jgi:hypothetical protein